MGIRDRVRVRLTWFRVNLTLTLALTLALTITLTLTPNPAYYIGGAVSTLDSQNGLFEQTFKADHDWRIFLGGFLSGLKISRGGQFDSCPPK